MVLWCLLNSLAPGKCKWNFRYLIFKQVLVIDGWRISCKIALIWMSLDFTDDQSTLVQVMAWCRQATSHYLSQCWPRSLTPYGVTRPQWVKWQNGVRVCQGTCGSVNHHQGKRVCGSLPSEGFVQITRVWVSDNKTAQGVKQHWMELTA